MLPYIPYNYHLHNATYIINFPTNSQPIEILKGGLWPDFTPINLSHKFHMVLVFVHMQN